jgi:TolA-binding protein
MTTPKQVSQFAKEYTELYIANAQLNSAVKIFRQQIADLKEKIAKLEENGHLSNQNRQT